MLIFLTRLFLELCCIFLFVLSCHNCRWICCRSMHNWKVRYR